MENFRVYLCDDKYISQCGERVDNPDFWKFVNWFKKLCGGNDPNPHSILSLTGEKNFGIKDGKPYSGFDLPATTNLDKLKITHPEIFFEDYENNSNVANLLDITK